MTTNQPFDASTFTGLGLDDVVITARDGFEWPVDPAGQGAAAERVFASLLQLLSLGAAQFRTVDLDVIGQDDLHLEADLRHTGVLRFSVGEGVVVRDVLGLRADEYEIDSADAGIVTVDLRQTRVAVATLSDGRVIGFHVGPGGTNIALGNRVQVRSGVTAPDIAGWCMRVSDPWLHEYLTPYLATSHLWHFCVAAGLFVRLREYSPAQAKEMIQRLIAGQVDPDMAAAYEWAAGLNEQQRQRVGDYARAEIDGLSCELDAFEQVLGDAAIGEPLLRTICTRRDDVEAVRTLFAGIVNLDAIEPALMLVDAAGFRAVTSLPEAMPLDEPRLARVKDADPDAWWLMLATT